MADRAGEALRRQIVSLVAYQGLRIPEEVLALEVRHVGRNTVLVEQRLIKGAIVGGQKVRGFHPRPVRLEEPVRRDVAEYLVATGLRRGLLFPARMATRGRSTTTRIGPGGYGTRRARG